MNILRLSSTTIIAVVMLTATNVRAEAWSGSLENLLRSKPEAFGTVMQDPGKFRLQIVYTQIDRDTNNKPTFQTFTYRLDPTEYFYPASTVKLPTAALALEKLKRLDIAGLNRDTTMLTGTSAAYQTEQKLDETSANGLPTVGNYTRKILLVSDNDAFNRLYEFVGQQTINEAMQAKGYGDTRIVHRLEVGLEKSQNQLTNPVDFVVGDKVIYQQPEQHTEIDFYGSEPEPLGVAEMVGGQRLEQPKDFSEKNAYSLMDQHNVVKNLLFPDSVPINQRFDLTAADYQFLHKYMSMYPGESDIQAYQDASEYPPGYVKFLMYGGDAPAIPANIRIFNKVGDAYGFLTDSAYIVDYKNQIEFLLSATIFTNENLTFNDDNYEYDEIGLPFLRDLGQVIYDIELNRKREFKPDLGALEEIEYHSE
jgi:hypothetical protein